ncbi:hypothetical protein FVEG_16828 [Fusarium verticillioides 7600]|uniref:Extracellular membrane protein CFEM domain-containing protein n=1 Tax=Gibberella moniliformis (strain M3125 / FGSC 7600) TaxID=334819 RepID=W7MKL9_GIBM7|nr:hypothetical protein FVEG_16828 [Fusarium verticillioides 7600]EWG51641.1 hypothetical protein FVEG_16828 [Fusarium verticillioides 7600]RBR01183.1 hypothetical protein FVER53263_20793 [Fusarium verticillioides]
MKFTTAIVSALAAVAAANPMPDEQGHLEARQGGSIICAAFTTIIPSFCPTLGGTYSWCSAYFQMGQCFCNNNDAANKRQAFMACSQQFLNTIPAS